MANCDKPKILDWSKITKTGATFKKCNENCKYIFEYSSAVQIDSVESANSWNDICKSTESCQYLSIKPIRDQINTAKVGGIPYELKEIRILHPSPTYTNSEAVAEMHLIHRNGVTNLETKVIIPIHKGGASEDDEPWKQFHQIFQTKKNGSETFNLDELIPTDISYNFFNGTEIISYTNNKYSCRYEDSIKTNKIIIFNNESKTLKIKQKYLEFLKKHVNSKIIKTDQILDYPSELKNTDGTFKASTIDPLDDKDFYESENKAKSAIQAINDQKGKKCIEWRLANSHDDVDGDHEIPLDGPLIQIIIAMSLALTAGLIINNLL